MEAAGVFRELDSNGDGTICCLLREFEAGLVGVLSHDELWRSLSDAGVPDEQIESLFFRLDANQDGKVCTGPLVCGGARPLAGHKG